MFPVRPEKEKALRERLQGLGISENDIEEKFIRHLPSSILQP